jgi:hypothetical protein
MKLQLIVLAAAAAISVAHAEPLVNEAVRVVAGKRVVELPPGPSGRSSASVAPVSNAWSPTMKHHAHVIETDSGLVECPYRWIDKMCRPYVKGQDTRPRAWVIKTGGQWRICPKRDDPVAKCAEYRGYTRFVTQD